MSGEKGPMRDRELLLFIIALVLIGNGWIVTGIILLIIAMEK